MSFRLKTIFGIALIELILLSILVISGLHYLRTSNEDQFLNRGETTARLAATMTSDSVVALDLATLDVLVLQILKNPDVVYMRVRHENGAVLAEGGNPDALARPFVADKDMASASQDNILDVTQPITIAERTLGHVELGLDIQALGVVMGGAKQWMLTVAGIEILLVALFGYTLGTLLTNQLHDLQYSARRVADGDFGYLLDVRGKDELAETASSFNQMSLSLSKFAGDLEQARRDAELKRELAESILTDAVNSIKEGIVIVDKDWTILHANSAYINLLTTPHTSDEDIIRSIQQELFDASRVNADNASSQWTVQQPDGRYVLNSRTPTHSGGWVFIKTDITPIHTAQERERQLERELLQAHKLEALGTLAGGIAHEINTPIHYIGDNLRFLGKSADSLLAIIDEQNKLVEAVETDERFAEHAKKCKQVQDDEDLEFLREEIVDAAEQSLDGIERVSTIVLAMKEFSHPTSRNKAPVSLNKIIERASIVCRNEWKHAAKLVMDLDPALPKIMGHEGELNQVILNLMVNAAQAIREASSNKGTISVRTRKEGESIRVAIVDTGPGVPEELRNRIFEPFFTTKDVGKGTGQGLALCRDVLVGKHNGQFWLEDTVPQGATFVFTLPIDG